MAVDAGVGQPTGGRDLLGGAEEVDGEGDGVDAEVEQRAAGELGVLEPMVVRQVQRLAVVGGDRDDLMASMAKTWFRWAAAKMSSTSELLRAKAFSMRTCLPAASASRACSRCPECGEAT